MNQDVENIFEGYNQILNENVEAPVRQPEYANIDGGDQFAVAERMLANGPGQDAETLQRQVQALTVAQDAIANEVEMLNMERDRVADQAAKGIAVEMDPSTGTTRVESQIQQLNDKMTRISQLAQSIMQPAQQMGVDVSPLMESFDKIIGILQECANWYVKCLVPGKDGASLTKRHDLKQMIMESNIPSIEFTTEEDDEEISRGKREQNAIMQQDLEDEEREMAADPNYLKDVLGYEPEDFEHEDPDQAAMDRIDAVDLANHDRPSTGPEDGLMGDVEALERLLDDETKAVMDDEGGAMSRREARETAKDILKQMIDRL